MNRVLLFGSLFDSSISGVIPAVGVLVGGAVVGLIRQNRENKKTAGAATSAETAHLESTVKEMNDFMVGTPATAFRPATPGFIDRFDSLEKKVDTHGQQLDRIDAKLDKALQNGNGNGNGNHA